LAALRYGQGVMMARRDLEPLYVTGLSKDVPAKSYHYAVRVTEVDYDVRALSQRYRDQADAKNAFDELKLAQPAKRYRIDSAGPNDRNQVPAP
jgi:ATP adenylyltransferase/5',5'''-P-1,P-4-tetraphosphate phosphorylase II